MQYVELLMQAIINKEIEIKKKYNQILDQIQKELELNQNKVGFQYSFPKINEILNTTRLDSSLYSTNFKKEEFLLDNYKNGVSSIYDLKFGLSRGQNLQVSNIGKSIESSDYHIGFYQVIKPTSISKYGTVTKKEYIGNGNKLKTLKFGDLIFGAEGTFRSFICLEEKENVITNIHGIVINQKTNNIQKSIFVKLMLDYFREHNICQSCATGGNGGSLSIEYWKYLKFPNFPHHKEAEIVKLYYNSPCNYDTENCNLDNFIDCDNIFNSKAGIYELDRSMSYYKEKLNNAINDIVNNIRVKIEF